MQHVTLRKRWLAAPRVPAMARIFDYQLDHEDCDAADPGGRLAAAAPVRH